jgi:uncharacterized phage-associated protein
VYNPVKAAQVIAYLALKTNEHAINVLKAIKLVYLVDRESIRRWGAPVLDEGRVSMPRGPVNSRTYSHINGEYDLDACGWSIFLEDKANHMVAVKAGIGEVDLDELSDADIQSLDIVWGQFGEMNQWQLVEWTHSSDNVPEWENPDGSSIPIPLARIMRAVGVENSDEQAKLLADHGKIEGLLKGLA